MTENPYTILLKSSLQMRIGETSEHDTRLRPLRFLLDGLIRKATRNLKRMGKTREGDHSSLRQFVYFKLPHETEQKSEHATRRRPPLHSLRSVMALKSSSPREDVDKESQQAIETPPDQALKSSSLREDIDKESQQAIETSCPLVESS